MRRPEGFDRPAPPPPTPNPDTDAPPRAGRKTGRQRGGAQRGGTIDPARSTGSGGSTRAVGSRAQDPSDGTRTEPIPVLPHLGSLSTLHVPHERRDPSTPRVPPEQHAPGSADRTTAATPAAPTLTPALARRRFRAARRARKRYEREEVRRFTWRSRRRRTAWIVALGTTLALAAFVLIGTYSPLMALRTIEVFGTIRIPADEVRAALSDQLGTPLPLVDVAHVRQDLSTFPLIQSYVTESRPPDTLVVRIVERTPVGTAVVPGGYNLLDAAGVLIQNDPARVAGFPIIDARAGVGSAGYRAATAVIAAVPASVRERLDTVTAATSDDVTLTLTGGALVVWGSAERSEYKAVVLAALVVSHPVGTVAQYDVSSPDSAVIR
jgi:cell division protein FtsQ